VSLTVLLSNDDGIRAEGLEALVKAFAPDWHVVVSAPMHQQSGMAHALTVGKPMEIVEDKYMKETYGVEAYAIDGTPTDCVKIYLEAIAGETRQPDVVISGINHGANLATDILYSGTVGAAMEGYLHDIHSFAVSLDIDSELSYDETAEALEAYLRTLDLAQREKRYFYNMNFPRRFRGGRAQYVFSRQGKRDYINAFTRETRADGRTFYMMSGEIYDRDKGEATDIYATEAGFVSVTPLITDLSDYPHLDEKLR